MKFFKSAKWLTVLVGLFLIVGLNLMEGAVKDKEKYEEKFDKTVSLAKEGEVALVNISGQIDVKTWNKGEVKIDALKISKASTLEKAKENAWEKNDLAHDSSQMAKLEEFASETLRKMN